MSVYASSLRSLSIKGIDDMISLPEELLQHVFSLEYLNIKDCYNLATLPHWTGSLTSLTYLGIHSAYKLTSLPEDIRSLKNLWLLDIPGCSQPEERCRKETGEDWPKIAHIPDINFEAEDKWLSRCEIPNLFSHFHWLHFYYLTFKMLWHHFVLIILHIAWNSWQP